MMPNDSVAEVVRLVVITWSGSLDLTTAVTVYRQHRQVETVNIYLYTHAVRR